MPTSNSPMRLDPELTAAARSSAASMSRSLSQQIAHWARIGRELERSPEVTVAAVQAVLGHASPAETLEVYTHFWPADEERTRVAIEGFAAHWLSA